MPRFVLPLRAGKRQTDDDTQWMMVHDLVRMRLLSAFSQTAAARRVGDDAQHPQPPGVMLAPKNAVSPLASLSFESIESRLPGIKAMHSVDVNLVAYRVSCRVRVASCRTASGARSTRRRRYRLRVRVTLSVAARTFRQRMGISFARRQTGSRVTHPIETHTWRIGNQLDVTQQQQQQQ